MILWPHHYSPYFGIPADMLSSLLKEVQSSLKRKLLDPDGLETTSPVLSSHLIQDNMPGGWNPSNLIYHHPRSNIGCQHSGILIAYLVFFP